MKLEKVLKLTLTEEEIESVQRTAEIFNNICNSYFDEDIDCTQCALYELCHNYDKTIHDFLYDFVEQLNTTKGA